MFDREINVRRAASAAFQENVGRQGNFPHGIEINTTADYFATGNRTNAYLSIAPFIAKYDEYRHHLIDHLTEVKSAHWEQNLRTLAATSLGCLTRLAPDYVATEVLPKLVRPSLAFASAIRCILL